MFVDFFQDFPVILIVVCGEPSGFYELRVLAGSPLCRKTLSLGVAAGAK